MLRKTNKGNKIKIQYERKRVREKTIEKLEK